MAVRLTRSNLYLVKRKCDEITSSFFPMRTTLLPSIRLTHTDGGMAFTDSEAVSSFGHQPLTCSSNRRGSKNVQP